MKILFCIDRYHPFRGGAEHYLADLCRALTRHGHQISVASLDGADDGITERIEVKAPVWPRWVRELTFSREVSRLKREGAFDRVVGFRHMLDLDLFQPHEGLFLDSLIGSIRPLSANPLVKALLFLKKLASLKNLFFLYADHRLLRRRKGLKVAALSKRDGETIQRRYRRAKPRVRVIPNGVDRKRFSPGLSRTHGDLLRKVMHIDSPCRVILFAAHNFRLKGLKEALLGIGEYMKSGAPALVLIAGRGKQDPYLKLCQRLGILEHVRFLGPDKDMKKLYAVADCLLHPTFYDPCSLVVMEALGAGVPVITTSHNGAAEQIRHGESGLVLQDPRDAKAMACALHTILDTTSLSDFKRKAKEAGAKNDFQAHVARMEAWITED